MTDPRRTAVNRINARRSTGPRTERGKSRVARNALRHGLSISAQRLPEFDATVAELARFIAGEGADHVRLDYARRIAEAQIDLQRVRSARRKLMETPVGVYNGLRELRAAHKLSIELYMSGRVEEAKACMPRAFQPLPESSEESERLFHRLHVQAGRAAALDRYERRALSRRKFAIRALDALAEADLGPVA